MTMMNHLFAGLIVLLLVVTSCLGDVMHHEYEAVQFQGKKSKRYFVRLMGVDSFVEWNIELATAGQHVLTFRHSNLIASTMNIVLNNGAEVSIVFPATGWSEWEYTRTNPVPLHAGVNVIVLKPNSGGGINVDKIMSAEFKEDDSGGDDGSDPSNNFDTVLRADDSYDHTQLIQNTLDSLAPNDSLHLLGDFVITGTIYLPSDFSWHLDGTMRLGTNSTLDIIGWRPAAITEKPGGATNIHMSGGYYDGNRYENAPDIRLINFLRVQNSVFRDMIIDNASDDNFSLGHSAQYNEVYSLISRYAGGNGLTDKGSFNKWFDCVAEFCDSDGWTPKSTYSEFHRCVARENNGPGFGLYARSDIRDVDIGGKFNGNSFVEIESYCNARSGISFNIATNCGPGAELMDNHVQGFFYKNGRSGVEFTNKLADGKIINNSMDVVAIDNYGRSTSTLLGGISVKVGGLAVPGTYGVADQVSGYFVGYGNNRWNEVDVNIEQATNSEVMVYETDPMPQVVGNANWQSSGITCPAQETDEWRVRKYCEMKLRPYQCVIQWE